jgi:hypothetical protein
MHLRHLPLLLLVLTSCARRAEDATALLSQVRQRLAARDGRLTSYQLAGTTREGEQQALAFTFAWRSPQRMLGTLGAPASRAFAWDGALLYERSDADRRFTTFRDELPADKRAGFLTETFGPFVPEGFRAPLLPGRGVSARLVSHALAREAVELTVRPEGTAGVEVAYVLRWPSLDFLGKRALASGTRSEVRVEQEQCEPALSLCVPRQLTRWVEGQQVGETTLTRVELNPSLPADTFTLVAPEGYEVQERTLVEEAAR